MTGKSSVRRDKERAVFLLCESFYGPFNLCRITNGGGDGFDGKRWCRRFERTQVLDRARIVRLEYECNPCDAGRNLLERVQQLSDRRELKSCKPSDVSARPGQAIDEVQTNW